MSEIIRFRPFWSLFIISTEDWLRRNSEAGLHLDSIDFVRRCFKFKTGEPEKYEYSFGYNKLSASGDSHKEKELKKNGWRKLIQYHKWCLYRTEKSSELGVKPNRRGLYLHNNSLLSAYNTVSFLALIAVVCASISVLLSKGGHSLAPFYILTAIFTALIVVNFSIFLWFSRENSFLLEELGSSLNPEYAIYRHSMRNKTFDKWLEKLFIREGDITRKFWPFWFFAPDRFETRLEKLERCGFNLYKTNKSGTVFYFTKGCSKNVRYCVIGNLPGGMDDTVNYLMNGWKVAFSTSGQFLKIILLEKQYNGQPPEFFKSSQSFAENAGFLAGRYAAITGFILVVVMAVTAVLILVRTPVCFVAAVVILILCIFLLRLGFYYRRSVRAAKKFS